MDWEESTVDGKQIEATEMPKQLLNTLFKDNAQSLNIPAQESAPPPPAMMTVMGVFDTILYLGKTNKDTGEYNLDYDLSFCSVNTAAK